MYTDRNGIYGAEQIDHRLALGFRAAGWLVSFAQPRAENPLVEERLAKGIRHHWLPLENIYDWRRPAASLSDPVAAEQCFAQVRPDLILFSDSFPFANLAAKQAAVRLGIPYLVLIHCVQPDWAEQYAAHLNHLPPLYRAAREVVAVSSENLELLRQCFGLDPDRGRVILNGRPDVFFRPCLPEGRRRLRHDLGVADDQLLLLSVGRYETVKGYDRYLDALPLLRRCPHWDRLVLAWAGSGTLEPALRRLAPLLGGGRLQILGERDDIPALLEAADLLVHPARFEGMPLVLLEAMAKGLPIIASAVSGIPEAVGEAALLLPSAPAAAPFKEQLAAAICAMAGDADRRRSLADRARARARKLFHESRMLDDWLALLRRTQAFCP
jgi:glycosyltransferase involved in cell wall biosynthesis